MDNREKEIFEDSVKKQAQLDKKIVLGVFSGLGLLFIILGMVLALNVDDILAVFSVMGAFLVVLGIILYLVIPEKYDYEKYKERTKKYGYVSYYEISAKLQVLEKQNEELEQRVAKLENDINNR